MKINHLFWAISNPCVTNKRAQTVKKIIPQILLMILVPLSNLHSHEMKMFSELAERSQDLVERRLEHIGLDGSSITVQFGSPYAGSTNQDFNSPPGHQMDYSQLEDFSIETVPDLMVRIEDGLRKRDTGLSVKELIKSVGIWVNSNIPGGYVFEPRTKTLWLKPPKMLGLTNVSWGAIFTNDNLLKPNQVGRIIDSVVLKWERPIPR